MSLACVGLGSNLGDRERHLLDAIDALGRIPGTTLVRASAHYESDPEGGADEPAYLNAAATLETALPPRLLLWHLFLIESRAGRERGRRPAPRPIDLDLLLFDQEVIDEPDLVLPHPRLLERSFVLEPLEEIAPDLRHPTAGKTIRRLVHERRLRA